MSNYYKTYIEPVIQNLGADASAELQGDVIAREYIDKLRRPLAFKGKTGKEVMTNYIYWDIVQFYLRANLVQNHSNDIQNYKLNINPGAEQEVKKAIEFVAQTPLRPIDERLKKFQFIMANSRLEKSVSR